MDQVEHSALVFEGWNDEADEIQATLRELGIPARVAPVVVHIAPAPMPGWAVSGGRVFVKPEHRALAESKIAQLVRRRSRPMAPRAR